MLEWSVRIRPGVFGPTGQQPDGGGDLDLAMTSYQLGMGTGLFPQLKVLHLIPKHRVEERLSLRNLRRGTYAAHLVNFFHFGPQSPARHSFASLRRVIRRVKQLLPRGWITLHERAVLEGTRRAEEDIIRLQSNAPLQGINTSAHARSPAGSKPQHA